MPSSPSMPIALHSRITVELVDLSGQAEPRELHLVPSEQADFRSGLLDVNAPLGRLLLGHRAGETLPYRAGDLKQVRILSVQTGEDDATSGAAEKRREAVQKAAFQSEVTSQMIFATASGSKWGDYEVDMEKLLDENSREASPPALGFTPLHFIDQPVEVQFERPPVRQKTPPCPDGFTWQGKAYRIMEKLSEWTDFTRRGRMARNMQPQHAAVAAGRGSYGVGRFFFRVRVETGQVFDLYYDRLVKDVDDKLGHWFLYRELGSG